MSLTGPYTEEVGLTALLRSNILANLLSNSKQHYSICITTVYYYGRIRQPRIIDTGRPMYCNWKGPTLKKWNVSRIFKNNCWRKCYHQGKPTWSARRYQPCWNLRSSTSPKTSLVNQGRLLFYFSLWHFVLDKIICLEENKFKKTTLFFFLIETAPFLFSPHPLADYSSVVHCKWRAGENPI